MTKLLSLDLSSLSSGWSVWTNGALDGYGIISTNSKHGWGQRLSTFRNSLLGVFETHSPDLIVVEDIYRGPSAVTFKVLSFFHGVAYNLIHDKLQIEPDLIRVSTVRSLVGKGVGVTCRTKEQAFHIMTSTLGFESFVFSKHNDIVDSFALAYGYFAENKITPAKPLKFVKDVYVKIGEEKDGPLQVTGIKQKRQQRGSKKSLPKAGEEVSSRRKSRKQGS